MDALGQRRAPDQMGRVFGLVGLVHLMADDLATVEVEDEGEEEEEEEEEEEVEPAPLHPGGQEGHIPAALLYEPGR